MREFVVRCTAREVSVLRDAEYTSEKQEHMQLAANFLRAIVEVAPRGQKRELQAAWKETLLQHVSAVVG